MQEDPFVEALNTLLTGSGISNNELGRRIEVDPAQIGRWRKGRGRPRPENLVRAAAVFGVDHRWLWALAYPEGVPDLAGPSDPLWTAFIAELEAGWRSMDDSTREMAARGARALFAIPTIASGENNRHRDGGPIRRSGGRRALDPRTRSTDDQGLSGGMSTVFAHPRRILANATSYFKRWLEPTNSRLTAQPAQ